jgi:hypothetical protein
MNTQRYNTEMMSCVQNYEYLGHQDSEPKWDRKFPEVSLLGVVCLQSQSSIEDSGVTYRRAGVGFGWCRHHKTIISLASKSKIAPCVFMSHGWPGRNSGQSIWRIEAPGGHRLDPGHVHYISLLSEARQEILVGHALAIYVIDGERVTVW